MTISEIDINIFASDCYNVFGDNSSLAIVPGELRLRGQTQAAKISTGTKKAGPMNVIAIDTSPEKGHGSVARLLDPLLTSMKEAGANVDLYYSGDLVIFPCCGNLNCTIRTPGNCMAYDDMRWLRQKIGQADILVLASPLYFNGQLGPEGATQSLKSLLRRLVPGKSPCADEPYEHAVHTTKEPVNLRKVIFVSGCGFWEIDDFYPVLTHIKSLCHNTFPEFAGNIGDGHGVILNGAIRSGTSLEDMMASARSAGRRIVNGDEGLAVDPVSLEHVTREMYDQVMKG